jgi:hypothetical protein
MIKNTLVKLSATILHSCLIVKLEQRHIKAKGKASFPLGHQAIDHMLTFYVIIEKAHRQSLEVSYCFVDFPKAFDSISREALFQRLHDIIILEILLVAIMKLNESVLSCLRTTINLSNFINSTI